MSQMLWLIVIAVAVILLVAVVYRAVAGRRNRPAFETRGLPASYVGAYQNRIVELRAKFVDNPREALAGAKQMVDDMTGRMGYPTRMTDQERLTDMGSVDRRHADRYRLGMAIKPASTTEEMRRAMKSYLDLAGDLLRGSAREQELEADRRPEIAS